LKEPSVVVPINTNPISPDEDKNIDDFEEEGEVEVQDAQRYII
jgi:hypothetical protein